MTTSATAGATAVNLNSDASSLAATSDSASLSAKREALGSKERIEAESTSENEAEDNYATARAYTASIKSSILDYEYENGRRYHGYRKEGSYFLPNDEDESDRLDLFHHIMTLRCGGELHLAPIGPMPKRILDLGTGTGIWAIDMGDLYPTAEVLGNDLSPIQPSAVPPNVRFEIDNIEEDWVYDCKFDYIHGRYLAGAIKDWPRLMSQAFRFTQPGGWVEFHDFDMRFYTTNGEFKAGCAMDRWATGVKDGVKDFGLEPEPGPKLERWIKQAGFINVHHRVLPIPVGTWPKDKKMKEMGAFQFVQFMDGLEAICLRVFTSAGWTSDELQVFLAEVRHDFKNRKMQAQHDFHVVYAQKPLDAA